MHCAFDGAALELLLMGGAEAAHVVPSFEWLQMLGCCCLKLFESAPQATDCKLSGMDRLCCQGSGTPVGIQRILRFVPFRFHVVICCVELLLCSVVVCIGTASDPKFEE